MGDLLSKVTPILVANMAPDKDPDVRLRLFSLISKLLQQSTNTADRSVQ